MKNKRLLWILVMLILVVSSVMVEGAIWDGLRGITGKVGGIMGFITIPVNAVIIGLLLYLLSAVVQFPKLGSRPGKIVFVVVLIILSAYLAFNISYTPEGKYQFIWSKPVVGEVMRYLFNSGADGKAVGILRPSRILIFAGASLIFSWFFVGFLKIGVGKYNKADYFLAMLIAAEATRAGMSKGMLIFVGQIIALFMLYTQFKKEQGRHWIVAFVWAYVLQSLVVSAIFKPEDTIWASWILTIIRIPRSLPGIIWLIIGLGVILPILVTAGIFVSKKEKDAKEKYGLKNNIWDYIKQPFLSLANKIKNPFLRNLFRIADIHDITPGEGQKEEFSFSLKEVWMELFTQMNYLLRLEVYRSKANVVIKERKKMDNLYTSAAPVEGEKGSESKKYCVREIDCKIDLFRNGSGYEFTTGVDSRTREAYGPDFTIGEGKNGLRHWWFMDNEGGIQGTSDKPNHQEPCHGINSEHFLIFTFFQTLRDHLKKDGGILIQEDVTHLQDEAEKKRDVLIEALKRMNSNMESWKSRMEAYMRRRGTWNVIHASRLLFLSQYKLSGEYKHNYKFARPGVKIYYVNYSVDSGEEPPLHVVKPIENTKTYSGQKVPHLIEVDRDGYFIDDLNEIRIKGPAPTHRLRKVDRFEEVLLRLDDPAEPGCRKYKDTNKWVSNIIDYPDYRMPLRALEREWEFFIRDVRHGIFHQLSKTFLDYSEYHSQKRLKNYGGIGRTHGAPTEGNPAFDREALKDIGRFVYWGRKKVWDSTEEDVNVEPFNMFPSITSHGISEYTSDYIYHFADIVGRKQRELFVWDTGEKAMFTGHPQEKKGGG